jgi:hypothetical protein
VPFTGPLPPLAVLVLQEPLPSLFTSHTLHTEWWCWHGAQAVDVVLWACGQLSFQIPAGTGQGVPRCICRCIINP